MDRLMSRKIKGIAICLMVLLHIFSRDWYIEGAPVWSEYIYKFSAVFKICVGIYAFLTGYAYFYSTKTVKYGMKKICSLLEHYWFQLFLIFIPIACVSGWKLTTKKLLVNMFGISPNINFFAWYVYFYVFCMLTMPLWCKILRFNFQIDCVIASAIPYIIEVFLHSLPIYGDSVIVSDLFNCFLYMPCVLIGFLFAKHNVFERVRKKLPNNIIIYLGLVIMILLLRLKCSSVFGFCMDVFYVPCMVYSQDRILTKLKSVKIISNPLTILGKFSTEIWFFHAVFFSTYLKDYFQWILWIVNNPVLVFLLCMTLSLGASIVINRLILELEQVFYKVLVCAKEKCSIKRR